MGDALHTHGGVTDAKEARLAQAGLIAVQGPTALDARTGVMAGPGSLALVTGTTTTGTMTVSVAAHHWLTSRGAANGPYAGVLEAAQLVNIAAAPGSNSRIDVVWSKQQDSTAGVPSPDGTTAPEYGVTTGTAAASPVKPAIPVGAEEIGTVTVAAGATNTLHANVTISNTARQTVARGGVIPARTKTERDAITGYPGQPVWRQDIKTLEVLSGAAGVLSGVLGAAKITRTGGTDSGARTNALGGLHAQVTISQPYGVGVPFHGFILAVSFVAIEAGSEAWLSVTGDPATSPNSRQYNTSGTAESRTVVAFNSFDTAAADTFAFQPLHKAVGTITPFADPNVAYSIIVAMPKAL